MSLAIAYRRSLPALAAAWYFFSEMSPNEPVHLLETTLRDGSYEVDFQFTTEDSAILASGLDAAGFRYVELGHGMGSGVRAKMPDAAANDLAYMRAAKQVVKRAKLGVIVVVGDDMTPPEFLDELPRVGIEFVRCAIWPNQDRPELFRFLERAKSLALTVSVNVMQSYALTPSKLAELAVGAGKAGADWFYFVDSAGGMLPEDVQTYVRALRETSGLQIGLHAHNNMGLALANSLAAIAAGATLVDATLNGIGRATGNPPTEQLLLAMRARGYEPDIDVEAVQRLGTVARSLYATRGQDPTHFASGAGMVHSRNLTGLLKSAKERGRAASEFLLRAGEEARKRGCLSDAVYPAAVIEHATEHSAREKPPVVSTELVSFLARELEGRRQAGLGELSASLHSRSRKRRKTSVLHLVSESEHAFDTALPWETELLAGISVPVGAATLGPVAELARPDVLLIDTALEHRTDLPRGREARVLCTQTALVVDACVDLISALRANTDRPVWIDGGESTLAKRLIQQLEHASIPCASRDRPPKKDRVIVCFGGSGDWIDTLDATDTIIIAGRAVNERSLVDRIRARGAKALVPLIASAIAARVAPVLEHAKALAVSQPVLNDGVAWVNPLFAPASGELVVDDTELPTSIVDRAEQSLDRISELVAARRAETLLSGRGRL